MFEGWVVGPTEGILVPNSIMGGYEYVFLGPIPAGSSDGVYQIGKWKVAEGAVPDRCWILT